MLAYIIKSNKTGMGNLPMPYSDQKKMNLPRNSKARKATLGLISL
jgi:hypothetical protein